MSFPAIAASIEQALSSQAHTMGDIMFPASLLLLPADNWWVTTQPIAVFVTMMMVRFQIEIITVAQFRRGLQRMQNTANVYYEYCDGNILPFNHKNYALLNKLRTGVPLIMLRNEKVALTSDLSLDDSKLLCDVLFAEFPPSLVLKVQAAGRGTLFVIDIIN